MQGQAYDFGPRDFTPQPDANGYMPIYGIPDYGPNPWEEVTNQSQGNVNNANNAFAQIPNMEMKLQDRMGAMQAFADSTGYPSFPNAGGLGSQQPFSSQPQVGSAGDSGSRSTNPWSLSGEALSR